MASSVNPLYGDKINAKKCGNLKHSESLLFSGDIESLEPSKF